MISRVYTSRFGNGTVIRHGWNLNRGGTEKSTRYQVQYPVENPPKVNRTVQWKSGKSDVRNVQQKKERTVVSTQNLVFINKYVSGGYDQISCQVKFLSYLNLHAAY